MEGHGPLEEQLEEQLEAGQEAIRQTTGMFAAFWEKLVDYYPTLLVALFVFAIGMLLARIITKITSRTMRQAKVGATAASFARSFVRIVFYVILVSICLTILGVPTASMITMIGAAGVTVGLALQNSLSNFAGGFVILYEKPFRTGDYVKCAGEEGYVDAVTILYTKLRMIDNRSIYLPNSIVSSGSVTNLSQRSVLRVTAEIPVSYATDLQTARRVLLRAVSAHKMILKTPKPMVMVSELGDNGIVLLLHGWVKTDYYFQAKSAMLECAKSALNAAGIEIPFPQLDVHTK